MPALARSAALTLLVLLALASALLSGCAGTPDEDPERSVEVLFERAQTSLSNGNYGEAIQRYESLIARYPFGAHALQAQLMIIYAHYLAGQYESVVAAADRFIRMHPQDENVAYALYMRGIAHQSMGPGGLGRLLRVDANLRDPEPKRRAFGDFRELIRDFPDSEYVDDAQKRQETIRKALAAHELYITDFYLERGAYIAAANRAQTVIAHYPGTPAVPEAMDKLARAYRGLGLKDLSEQVDEEIRRRHEVPLDLPLQESPESPSLLGR
ncbi:outer membrane protein assembly factor BamD [Halorhodospira abdelmalekii]|uniref:outer membrane protein assembly factor BamD n=1 Tax=Halorhodospira abdelmalekii TaxID=421629 RepID=UPI001905930F|nr:outer membrane protein assembly factor BamD [Halorhodospira abdelmalekii]MBK1734718.1 outer membrane protein assembly factor BamD [Halorhodospira abdelmalekii]